MKPLVLIRPEPGLSASADRARALGLEVIRWPLFRIEPVAWQVPDMDSHDAILLTSANAVRMAGSGLSQLLPLPVYAVGEATAAAARRTGLSVVEVGDGGVDGLLASIPENVRLLHLTGADRIAPSVPRNIRDIIVYRSVAIDHAPPKDVAGSVIAVHSPRAGQALAGRIDIRDTIAIAAISEAAGKACGSGWAGIAVAAAPSDEHLLPLAATLCQTGGQ